MGKILDIVAEIFELDSHKEENREVAETVEENQKKETIDLFDVINFVREIESYYTSEIFNKKAECIKEDISLEKEKFLGKQIRQYENAKNLITKIKEELSNKTSSSQELWTKSSYSFYNELEEIKTVDTLKESFEIVKQLAQVNVIPELDNIIIKRIEQYRQNWNIEDVEIPKNKSLRIVKKKGNIETYQFAELQKHIIDKTQLAELSVEQLIAINNLAIKIILKKPAENLWIRAVAINRKQLDFLKKTTVFPNNWEEGEKEQITYDIISYDNLIYYIKAILQLLLTRDDFVLISVINPNEDMKKKLNRLVEIDEQSKKVKVIDEMSFILPERTGKYEDNLQFVYVSRKHKLQKLNFQSYENFVKKFL